MSVEKPKRILCPVDFSRYSAAALKTAGNLAKSAGASVTVLHAQAMDAPVYFTAAQEQALKAQLRKSRRAGEKQLDEFAREHLPEGIDRAIVVVEDDPDDRALFLEAVQELGLTSRGAGADMEQDGVRKLLAV